MKFLAYVFLIIVPYLACIPCADFETNKDIKQSSVSSESHDHSDDDSDLCSPLCVCACCSASSITKAYTVSFVPFFNTRNSSIVIYKEPPFKDLYYSIWQPPKIA